jgi:hypothetical protein
MNELSKEQIKSISKLINQNYNQGKPLAAQVVKAQEKLEKYPELIKDDKTREIFLTQDPRTVASKLCTTVSRYVHILVAAEMGIITNEIPDFVDYYLDAVEQRYVVVDKGSGTLCYINGPTYPEGDSYGEQGLIAPYLSKYDYWEGKRKEYKNDSSLLGYLKKVNPPIAMIRDGNKDRGKHTFCIVKCDDGNYRMLDTGHFRYTGKIVDERYGLGTTRYLWTVYGYIKG